MKKNYLKIISKTILITCLGVFLISCEGEDGINGENGINGEQGIDGENGINGENGVGFDELVKYGSITINVAGTRPDDVAFTQEHEFRFIPNYSGSNDVSFEDSDIEFDVTRFINTPDADSNNSIYAYLGVEDAGLETQSFYFEIEFNGFSIVSDDLKYFQLWGYYSSENSDVTNFSITNYSFNDTTNNLTYSFTMDIEEDVATGNDLTVSGTVNVIVLERLQSGPILL
ncbi:hypothetical protein QLS71_008750 [Mariniflexile litorale]|uniref:Collagen-like protein n=1 Tax=Mariniflexile litorale TaxID=3045158 RepID=A0AAU7EKA8_9FLAO|nr:hypothetical protein [Mariniflexile sp. KMM 9835]MDQ8212679.1 hypothetical protein [Mariniflexile sp. KMM 9835]